MRESDVEEYLCSEVLRIGGLCEKFTSPQRRGVPDRLVTYKARMIPVELKKPDEKPTPAQLRDHARRLRQGVQVHVLTTTDAVDAFIHYLVKWR